MTSRVRAAHACIVILSLMITSRPSRVLALQTEEEWPPPLTYSAKPVQGRVVDAGTGEPLDGVIVVAQWILYELWVGTSKRLHVFETTTDRTGNYLIPGWGPKRNAWYPLARLLDRDPELVFFKRGFVPLAIQNRWDRNDPVRFSEWDGKTIMLRKFTGIPEEWAKQLSFLQDSLAWGRDVMDWRLIPRTVLALEEEQFNLSRKRLKLSNVRGLDALGTTIEEVREFLERQE